ncbi:hypothetical protein KCU77_g7012, partial [Aureobasidium melanogenum]
MSKSITANEVKEHATPEKGLYIIIDKGVYSMADFVDEHPGGAKILKRVGGKGSGGDYRLKDEFADKAGTDASKQFWKYHNEGVLKKYQPRLKIGELKEEAKL